MQVVLTPKERMERARTAKRFDAIRRRGYIHSTYRYKDGSEVSIRFEVNDREGLRPRGGILLNAEGNGMAFCIDEDEEDNFFPVVTTRGWEIIWGYKQSDGFPSPGSLNLD